VIIAGCGSWSPVEFGEHAHVVGLDIDEDALVASPEVRMVESDAHRASDITEDH